MLSLPKKNPTDTICLADWLEIYALISGDRNSSRGDLESALRTASLFEPEGDEAIQRKILEVFQELEDRSKSAKEAYPFVLDKGVLRVREKWEEFPAYVFCLCLSYFGVKQTKGIKVFPRRWFEHISRDALTHYLGVGGESLRFGSPRLKSEIPVGFKDAIDRVCTKMKEGEGYKEDGGLPNRKDDAVDIIAWKHFPDQLPGKLIVFGNCATERDWEGAKKTELTPAAFCSDWMMDMPKCEIVRTLFIPHRVEHKRFLSHLKRTGIIFDRCRVSYWAYFTGPIAEQVREKRFFDYRALTQWSQGQLKAVK
jgi:hypothetical protein